MTCKKSEFIDLLCLEVIIHVITNSEAITMFKVKVTTVGNSAGIALPKEALKKMRTDKGDTLFLVETDAGYTLTPYDQDFDKQLKAAQKVMKKYKNSLRALAK